MRQPLHSRDSLGANFRRATIALAAISGVTIAAPAWGHATGVSGYSGKQTGTCNDCHSGGTAPTVTLTGPTALLAGQTGSYTLRVETGAAAVGMNAAATDGVKLTAGTNQKLLGVEVTQNAPVPQTNGAVEFTFTLQAPNVNGPTKLWAAGNAVNLDDTKTGDLAATTSITIEISGATAAAPDAGAATTSAGGGDASVASTSTGANASNARAPGATSADGGAVPFYLTGADQGDKPEFADTGMSCSVGNGSSRSPLALLGLGLAIAALRSRRRR